MQLAPGFGLRVVRELQRDDETLLESFERKGSRENDPRFPVATSKRPHPIPSRTRKLSSSEPMVLHGKPCGRVGRCRDYFEKPGTLRGFWLFPFVSPGLAWPPVSDSHELRTRASHARAAPDGGFGFRS